MTLLVVPHTLSSDTRFPELMPRLQETPSLMVDYVETLMLFSNAWQLCDFSTESSADSRQSRKITDPKVQTV